MQQAQKQVPLWRQLQETAAVVGVVRKGTSGTSALESVETALRPGVQALAFRVWRNLGRAQALRNKLVNRLPAPPVDALLCTALALVWDADSAPYDAFTLVNQTVEAAKRSPQIRAQGNFLNACLRRFLRDRDLLVSTTDHDLSAVWNYPAWWIQRVQRDHPDCWSKVLGQGNAQAPMTLRVNTRQHSRSAYLAKLNASGIAAHADGPFGICLQKAVPVKDLPDFNSGSVSVQDGAAQLAAPLLLQELAPASGTLRILDACAAPGGKTGHLLELSNAAVTALDVAPERCKRINENLARLKLRAHVQIQDASKPQEWWDGVQFDGILLDAPCTASGIVRRHPDVRWLRRETDIAQLAAIQQTMLVSLWDLLKPGGALLYCTCSIFKTEGQEQVQTFLAHNTDAILLPSPGHLMPQTCTNSDTIPDNETRDHDGFFFALLKKQMR